MIGNPPWERVKVQDREFFSLTDPVTAGAVNANDRKKRIAAMPKANPELYASLPRAPATTRSGCSTTCGSDRFRSRARGT